MGMKLFLDSNVVIDALVDRNEAHEAARLLVALGRIGEFDLWASPTQWTDMYYILTEGGKRSRDQEIRAILAAVRKAVHVSMMGEEEIDRALASSWDDFEDAVVYQAAVSVKPDALITNNKKDYVQSAVPVYTCAELFELIAREKDISYTEIAF